MDAESQVEQIEQVVRRFAEIAPSGWARLVGNWEATPDDSPEGVSLNFLTLAVVAGEDRWLLGQVGYDEPLYDLVAALNREADDDRRWTVLDLEVDADGAYRTSFGYDEPKRTNGVIDEESMGRFESYLDGWVAENGPVPGSRS